MSKSEEMARIFLPKLDRLLDANPSSKVIELSLGLYTIVDKDDYVKLDEHRWHADRDKTNFYARSHQNNTRVAMHRMVTNAVSGEIVDHINGNGLDNRRSNLRILKHQFANYQNSRIRDKNTTGYKGVTKSKESETYRAQIKAHGESYYLGSFDTGKDAARAYDIAAYFLHGEYAKTNHILGLLDEAPIYRLKEKS